VPGAEPHERTDSGTGQRGGDWGLDVMLERRRRVVDGPAG